MFQTLIRKVSALLRNTPIREPDESIPFDLDAFFDTDDPWYTTVYWFVYRSARRVRHAPHDAYYAVKYFIQRGCRGWADRDTWSLDWYVSSFMPDALRHLKVHKHGVPLSMFDPQDDRNHDTALQKATARWDAVMDRMIAAFEASKRMQDGLYEDELGSYPMGRPAGVSRDAWDKVRDDRMAASRLLEERDTAIFREGMTLFAAHFFDLWD